MMIEGSTFFNTKNIKFHTQSKANDSMIIANVYPGFYRSEMDTCNCLFSCIQFKGKHIFLMIHNGNNFLSRQIRGHKEVIFMICKEHKTKVFD